VTKDEPDRGKVRHEFSSPLPRRGEESPPRRLESLGKISAELLHDLGSHLSVLEGRVAVARTESALGRSTSGELARIQAETRELRKMVVDILDEVRGAPRSPEVTTPVQPLLEEVIHRWLTGAPRVSPSLRTTLPADTQVPGPRSFYSRALGNLLRNASRHARSRILITACCVDSGRVVEIVVEDDGDGVPPELREGIFSPFVAGSGGGAGLGLSFAKWAADQLGGSLELISEPGELGGAAFRFQVPIQRPANPLRRSPGGAGQRGCLPPGVRVAIIDDDQAIRRVLRRRLHGEGARVLTPSLTHLDEVGTLLEELFRWDPQIVLLDLNLGGGLSGANIHEMLARRHPHLASRVLFLTGGPAPDHPIGAPVLNKLQDWDDLVERMCEVLP
jgi:CheY-like chemotaxis protein